jgi:hypothetical protein
MRTGAPRMPVRPDRARCHELGGAAVQYASALGWPIRPQEGIRFDGYCTCFHGAACRDPGKHPARQGWQKMATTDVDLIRSWWLLVPFNIATHLTHTAVVDIDHDGDLEHLQQYGPWPVTPIQQSGRGWHLFFRVPDDGGGWPVLSSLDGRKIETKGPDATDAGGSSLTLAPSRHRNGGTYRWLAGRDPFHCPLAPVPDRFLSHVRTIAQRRQAVPKRAPLDATNPHAVAALIAERSAKSARSSNGLGRGVYGVRKTLEENGADARTIEAATRAWWRHHGREVA